MCLFVHYGFRIFCVGDRHVCVCICVRLYLSGFKAHKLDSLTDPSANNLLALAHLPAIMQLTVPTLSFKEHGWEKDLIKKKRKAFSFLAYLVRREITCPSFSSNIKRRISKPRPQNSGHSQPSSAFSISCAGFEAESPGSLGVGGGGGGNQRSGRKRRRRKRKKRRRKIVKRK